jgi:uncharacterized LabA/DUF88 family protein
MKVSIFIDGRNIFHAQRVIGWRIDYVKLLKWASAFGEIVDAIYYTGVDAVEAKDQKFLDFLTYNGYSLETKNIKRILQTDGSYDAKANLDIEIVLDMFNTINCYDMAILLSGDGDFERALRLLKARGKQFKVLSVQGMVASEIRTFAGMHYIDIASLRSIIEY